MILPGIRAALARRARRLLLRAAAALLAGLCAVAALGFAFFAAFLALAERLGRLDAALILAAACALAAILIAVLATSCSHVTPCHAAPPPNPATPDLAALLAAAAPDQAALLALATRLGAELTPMQLVLAALIGGVLSGRKLGR